MTLRYERGSGPRHGSVYWIASGAICGSIIGAGVGLWLPDPAATGHGWVVGFVMGALAGALGWALELAGARLGAQARPDPEPPAAPERRLRLEIAIRLGPVGEREVVASIVLQQGDARSGVVEAARLPDGLYELHAIPIVVVPGGVMPVGRPAIELVDITDGRRLSMDLSGEPESRGPGPGPGSVPGVDGGSAGR